MTTPTPSQVMSPTPTTSRRLRSSPTQSPWPPPLPVLQARVPRGRRVRWLRTRGYASRSTPITCLPLPARNMSVGQSSSSVSERTGRPVGERTGRLVGPSGQELNVEHAQIRTLLDRQKEQILAECQAEIRKHEFQADCDRRSIQKLSEMVDSQQEELHCARGEEVQQRDQQLLHDRLLQQKFGIYVKLTREVSLKWKS